MVEVKTYWAKIFVGLKIMDYSSIDFMLHDSLLIDFKYVASICHEYVNSENLCVTFTETLFIYSDDGLNSYNGEPGVIIGLINYPRYPDSPEEIRRKTIELAQILKRKCGQKRLSIMFPDTTIMLDESE